MNDDSLFMDWKPISASGGCSAPVAKGGDDARLGKMKIRLEGDVEQNKPTLATLMINHPNYSGLSRSDTRVQYVKHVSVSYAVKEIMSAEVDFTVSENPNFRFNFVPQEKGELKAKIVDTNDLIAPAL
ncbi:MAG: thiosulfate oxidation carrier complex protein SoxZ [Burkholderiales bacterium]